MNIPKAPKAPEINPDFTMEDLHKVREYKAEKYWFLQQDTFWAEIYANSLRMQATLRELRDKRFAQDDAGVKKAAW